MYAEDLENALNTKPPTLKDVFETWYRFSHTGNTQYNLSNATGQALADLQGWQFDENKMRIANNVNTGTYTGFISIRKYKKYTLGIKVCGPDEEFEQLFGTAGYLKDDDTIKAMNILYLLLEMLQQPFAVYTTILENPLRLCYMMPVHK